MEQEIIEGYLVKHSVDIGHMYERAEAELSFKKTVNTREKKKSEREER